MVDNMRMRRTPAALMILDVSMLNINTFLPTPEELVFREETVKVTIALSKASLDFLRMNY
jgi:hypothetical protein